MGTTSRHTLEYELTRADLDAFATHHAAHAPDLAQRIRRMRFVWAVVFAVIAVEYGRISPVGAVGFGALGVAYIALYGRLNRFLYVQQSRGLKRGPEVPGVGPVTLTLMSGALLVDGRAGQARVALSRIRRVEESPSHYFVYVGPTAGLVVPRAGVATGDPEAFVRALRAALPAA